MLKPLVEGKKPEEIKNIKVLDPAIGSGHFLVEATDYLANSLIDAYGKTDKELEEDDIILARREVVEKCIYGVDINPLAVELAKLSLWLVARKLAPQPLPSARSTLRFASLHTISKNRSLAFLDHHIKCGNSLIGAEIKDLSKIINKNKNQNNQLTLFSSAFKNKIKTLLEKFAIIEKIPSNTYEDIKEKEKHYKEFKNIVQRFKEVANLWMSTYFGNEISSGEYNAIQSKLLSGETEWNKFKEKPCFKNAIEIAKKNKFFHWELEFPEVFFENSEKKENAGFDAVIGNPPYARERDNKSLFAVVKNTPIGLRFYEGKMDYWYFFLHKAIELSKNKISFIVPHYWLSSTGAKKLLERIRNEVYFEKIVDFGKFKVFPSASGQHNIFVFSKSDQRERPDILIIKDNNLTKDELNNAIYGISEKGILRLLLKNQEDLFDPYGKINLEAPKYINLLNKIEKEKIRISDLAEVNQGIVQGPDKVTSRNVSKVAKELGLGGGIYEFLKKYQINIGDGVFVLNNSELSNMNLNEVEKSIIKPFFEPSQVMRFYCSLNNYEWIIYSTKEVIKNIHNYPNIQKHLDKYLLLITSDNKPYGLHRPRNPEIFKNPKIIGLQMGSKPTFAYCEIPYYVGMSLNIISSKDNGINLKYLVSILNSTLAYFWFKNRAKKRGAELDIGVSTLEIFPIPNLKFKTPKEDREKLVANAKQLYKKYIPYIEYSHIIAFLTECIEKNQSDVVHDILVFLAEKMSELNQQKHNEIKDFLEWLKREIGAKIEDLSNKTKIKSYYANSYEVLLEILKKNKNKISVNPSIRQFQKLLKDEYDKSIAILKPLEVNIKVTDKLIDQIVYKLYGLTEDEIKIVEGST